MSGVDDKGAADEARAARILETRSASEKRLQQPAKSGRAKRSGKEDRDKFFEDPGRLPRHMQNWWSPELVRAQRKKERRAAKEKRSGGKATGAESG